MIIGPGWKVAIEDMMFQRGYKVSVYQHFGDKIQLLKVNKKGDFETVDLEPAVRAGEDEFTFKLPINDLQPIMKALWDKGVRPEDKRYENEIELLKNHIKDLQKLLGLHENKANAKYKIESH